MTKTTIEIFRAGRHTAMNGQDYTFSRDDLLATAAAYDPAVFSSPLVIGHPKHDDQAYGWASAMRVEGDVLLADVDQVEPAFAELVNAGRYKKVSPWFYPPAGKNNPVPGVYYPRHIGFLGAAAPGCQGLAPAAFAEGEADADFVAFASDEALRPLVWMARSIGRVLRRMRDDTIANDGIEAADKLVPEYEIEAASDAATRLEAELTDTYRPAFAAPAEAAPAIADAEIRAAELVSREAAVAEREAAAQARDAAFAEGQRETRAAEDETLLDELIAAGRLAPGYRSQLLGFCTALDGADAICFAEGEDAQDPRIAFRGLLSGNLGVVIRFDEIAEGDGLRFAEGQSADQLASAARALVSEARARGETLSVSAAMATVTAGR